MKKVIFILLITLLILGCKRKILTDYSGWTIIQKNGLTGYYDKLIIQKGSEIKKISTYEYFYKKYHIGDMINEITYKDSCEKQIHKFRSDLEFYKIMNSALQETINKKDEKITKLYKALMEDY